MIPVLFRRLLGPGAPRPPRRSNGVGKFTMVWEFCNSVGITRVTKQSCFRPPCRDWQRQQSRWYKYELLSASRRRGRFLGQEKGGTASSPANYCKPAGHVCCARARPRWTRPGLFRGWPRRRPRGQTEAALTTQQMYPGDTWAEFAELQSFPVKSSAHLSWLVYNGVSKPPLCEVAQADAECWTRSHPPSLPSYVLLSLLLGSLA